MTTYYIDPVNGDDNNDGSTEALAKATLDNALSTYGFTTSNDGLFYQKDLNEVVTFLLLRDLVVLNKGFYVGGPDLSGITIAGKNGAKLLFTGDSTSTSLFKFYCDATNSTISFTFKNLAFINATGNLSCAFADDQITLAGGQALLHLHNIVIKDFTPITMNNVDHTCLYMTNVTANTLNVGNTGIQHILDSVLDPNKVVNIPNGLVAINSEQIKGNGAFLPQPIDSFDYDPQNGAQFVTNGWVNDSNYTDGDAKIEETQITINSGTSCRVLSPVFHYEAGIKFSANYIKSVEDESLASGSKEVIDSSATTATREIEVRVSNTAFGQTDSSPSWESITKGGSHASYSGNFVQFRITLRTDGV